MNLLIGIIASAIILFQTYYLWSTLPWLLGAGVSATGFLFFLAKPLIAMAVLWSGWSIVKYKALKYRKVFSFGLSIVVIVVVGVTTPTNPLTVYLQQRTLNSVQAQNIADETLLSSKGNPIGIRLIYKITFPLEGIFSISPSGYAPLNGGPDLSNLQLSHFLNLSIEPEPPTVGERPGGVRYFKANTSYRFIFDVVPEFLKYDKSSKTYCIYLPLPDPRVKPAIAKATKVQYKTIIKTDLHDSPNLAKSVTKGYVTENSYSVKEFYDGAIREGAEPCRF